MGRKAIKVFPFDIDPIGPLSVIHGGRLLGRVSKIEFSETHSTLQIEIRQLLCQVGAAISSRQEIEKILIGVEYPRGIDVPWSVTWKTSLVTLSINTTLVR